MKSDGGVRRAAVFLDRDGTINEDPGWISDPAQVRLFRGVPEALRRLRQLEFLLIVVSNQSGVARGLLTFDQVERVNRRVFELAGIEPDRFYYCPHHPTEGSGPFTTACSCRKPATGMVLRGIREFDLDPGHSFMIGDSEVDVACGKGAGVTTALVRTGLGDRTLEKIRAGVLDPPDHVAADLEAAVDWISSRVSKGRARVKRSD